MLLLKGREKNDKLLSNHALESDDKEESEYASPMIITICSLLFHLHFHFHRKSLATPSDSCQCLSISLFFSFLFYKDFG